MTGALSLSCKAMAISSPTQGTHPSGLRTPLVPVPQAFMQADGNFVVRNAAGSILWQSGTNGHPAGFVRVQNESVISGVDSNGVLASTGASNS